MPFDGYFSVVKYCVQINLLISRIEAPLFTLYLSHSVSVTPTYTLHGDSKQIKLPEAQEGGYRKISGGPASEYR